MNDTMNLPGGPALAGPQLFELFFTDPFPFLRKCHETHGDLFTLNLGTFGIDRFGASGAWVFVCSAEHLQTVFRAEGVLGGAANTIQFQGMLPPESSVMMDGPEHLERRRVLSRLVQGEKKIRGFTDVIHRLVLAEVGRFPPDEAFTLTASLRRISSEVMRHLTFGPAASEATAGITARLGEFGSPALSPADKHELVADCGGVLLGMMRESRACPHAASADPDSIFSLLRRAQESDAGMQDPDVCAELLTILVGGTDTTSSTMTWVMAWILTNDGVLARVQEELRRVLGDRPPCVEDIDRLEYLDAVIKESCRISPLLFNSSARLLREPLVLGEYTLPAGTIVASCAHVIHTRPDYYEDPLRFDAERFMGGKPDPHRWVPFGGGIRRCLGMAFALYEMKVVIASLLQQVRFEPVDVRTTAELQGSFFAPAGGVRVRLDPTRSLPMASFPEVTRTYQNHHLDSTRWQRYTPRDGDVVISTSIKAGTTWMQTIVAQMVFPDGELPGPLSEVSPWLDARILPADPLFAALEAQTHRRFLKTHLPLDGLPYFPNVRYIMIGRDPRDIFMSLWNHYSNFTPTAYELVNETPGRVGDPLPVCDGDIRGTWRQWISRGSFPWEQDGWPFWSHLHHAQSWWNWRHLPNVLLVHYNDLLADLPGEMRRVAEHLGAAVEESLWPRMIEAATFAAMRENADKIFPMANVVWSCGSQALVNKGTNGRWRDVLTDEDLALYAPAMARALSPDCARWLEAGRGGSQG